MNILLAEDDTNIATIARLALEKLSGHDLTWVDNGQKAIELLKSNSFDVVLLDEMMPEKNGLSAAQEIREVLQLKVPIIFLSAKSRSDDVDNFMKWGQGHIAKPFDPKNLSQLILDILQKT